MPVWALKNFLSAFGVSKPQKPAMASSCMSLFSRSSFARASLTAWISSRMLWSVAFLKRISACRLGQRKALRTSAALSPSHDFRLIMSRAAATDESANPPKRWVDARRTTSRGPKVMRRSPLNDFPLTIMASSMIAAMRPPA